MMEGILIFILGICFGSFYTVLGMRIPRGENVLISRSHCENCHKELKWYELIPLFSFLIQRGKCLNCKAKLSLFYPFCELATGLLFFISYYSFGFSLNFLIAIILVSTFIVVLVSDLTYLLIPDRFIIIPAVLIFVIQIIQRGFLEGLLQLLYGLLAFILMYLVMLLGNKLFKKESLGGADIKLMFLIGLVLDPFLATVVLFVASVIALPVSLILLWKNNEHIIPYGPFLMVGLLIVYFTKLNIQELFDKLLLFFS